MAIANDAAGTTNWTAYNVTTNWLLARLSGTNTVFARFRTAWLDETTNVSAWIIADTNPPVCTALFPPDGYVATGAVMLTWSGADPAGGAGIAAYRLQTNGSFVTLTTSAFLFGVSNAPSNSWRVMAWDAAGNAGPWTSLRWFMIPEPAALALGVLLLCARHARD
jgi:hypothetical protein